MKGQNRILSEILLFSIGIMITGYVVMNFESVEKATKETSTQDQLDSIANTVSSGIVKVSYYSNASLRLEIPDKVSGSAYKISISGSDGGKIRIATLDGSKIIERKIFNIHYDNRINSSEVVSSSKYIEIVKNELITLRRVALDPSIDIP